MSLEVRIEKQFGNFFLNTDFVTRGENTALLGASGCGKSLTMKCIAGIIRPDRGRIVLNGNVLFDSDRKINLPPQKRGVGYLFQNYALFENMTVAQNIECGISAEKNKKVRKEKIAAMIERMQLTGLENHKPGQLSGGQQQRVALARILIGKPQIVLLDEPFSALDSYLKDRLLTEVKNILAGFKQEVLMVTHSRDEAYMMCNHLLIMENGSICVRGKTREVFASPNSVPAAVLTGCKNIYRAHKAGDTAVAVPELGICLEAGRNVDDDLCAVGIRAHSFNPKAETNLFPVVPDEEIESPFEWTIKFRYAGQKKDSPSVWWRLPKEQKTGDFPKQLGIAPANLLLLYPDRHEKRGGTNEEIN